MYLLIQTITGRRDGPVTNVSIKWHDIPRDFPQYKTFFSLRIISLENCNERRRMFEPEFKGMGKYFYNWRF